MEKKAITLQQMEEALRDLTRWIRDKLAGYMEEPAAEGESGYVLTTNGAGGYSWEAPHKGDGDSDFIWRPTVSAAGDLSWKKSKETAAPEPVNIKGPGYAANLLDNWYFVRPVNQRGETSVPGYEAGKPYFIDRWKRAGYTAATLTLSGGVTFDNSAVTAGGSGLMQILENTLPSGTYTMSVYLAECNGSCWVSVNNSSNTVIQSAIFTEAGVHSMTVTSGSIKQVRILARASSSIKVLAVKLELGDTQTLAHQDEDGNWQLNEIPKYSEQLAECQRYYQTILLYTNFETPIAVGIRNGATTARIPLEFPQTFRAVPTLTIDDSITLAAIQNGTAQTLDKSGVSVLLTLENRIILTITGTDFVSGYPVTFYGFGVQGKNSYISFSADL